MKSLVVICLLVLGARAFVQLSPVTECYESPMLMGRCIVMTTSVPDLRPCSFDNTIDSVKQTGIWVYYENPLYNLMPGGVYYSFGINYAFTFPVTYRNTISSVRLITKTTSVTQNQIILFEGTYCTKEYHIWHNNVDTFSSLADKLSSILIVGSSPWTIYTGETFTGSHVCVFPNVIHPQPQRVMSLGIYVNISMLGFPSNIIKSVKRGCWSKRKFQSHKLNLEDQKDTGGWGKLM